MKLIVSTPSSMGWSKLGTMLMCPRKFALQYLQERTEEEERKEPNPALVKGILIHLGLAHYYASKIEDHDPTSVYTFDEAIYKKCEQIESWYPYLSVSHETLVQYIFHYSRQNEDARMKVLGVEKLIKTKIDEQTITGRVDLIAEDTVGKVWFVDHKTTNKIDEQQQYYAASGQMIGYQYIGREMYGDKFGGMLLNLIKVADDQEDAVFERHRVSASETMLDGWPTTVRHSLALMENLKGKELEEYPMAMHELICQHRYGPCRFMKNCMETK